MDMMTIMLEQFIDNHEDGIFSFDLNFNVTFWNSSMERISGFEKADILGKNIFSLFPALKEIGEDWYFKEALLGKYTTSKDKPFNALRLGKKGFFVARYSPLYDEVKNINGGMVVIRDTTEQKESEDKIKETEVRFRTMANCAPVALWMARTDGLCDFFNEGWLKFRGRTQEEEFGVGWAEGIHPEDFQKAMDTYLEAFSQRKSFSMEYRLRRHDGVYRWILDNGVPRFSPEGIFMGYIGSCIDFTDRKEALDQLSLSVERLKASVRARDEFITLAAHELRTPLTPLKVQIQTLKRHFLKISNQPSDLQNFSKILDSSSQQIIRFAKLVEDLLEFSKISVGQVEFNREEMDLVQSMKRVISEFQTEIKNSSCQLDCQFPEHLFVQWDRMKTEMFISCLLSNALKYGEGKPIHLEIKLVLDKVVLIFQDHGIGMSEEDQRKLFKRYEKASSIRTYGGLGLGLYLTYYIVEAHGGKIRVESALKKGTKFTIEIPLKCESCGKNALEDLMPVKNSA